MARDKYDVNGDEKKGVWSFFYDGRTGAILGRTAKSWALIVIFYAIYYALLAGFFVGMIKIFFLVFIDQSIPRLTGAQSMLRGNPGLSFLPKPAIEATIVKTSTLNGSTYFNSYIKDVKTFLASYGDLKSNQVYCKDGNIDVDQPCYFDLKVLNKCAMPVDALLNGSVCVYAKMNKIFGWLPSVTNPAVTNNTLISCQGQNPGDNENMGDMIYNPQIMIEGKSYGYFDNKYFPYLQQDNYSTPLVGIEFTGIKNNVIVLVKCELSNIEFSDLAPVGSGTFEIFVGTQ